MTVHFDSVEAPGPVDRKPKPEGARRSGSVYGRYGKRVFDLVLVILAAPILVPLALILALAIALCGHRPIFVQRRVGLDGKVFPMWKFRTMVNDAETVLSGYLEARPDARAEWDAHQKLKSDPRITLMGRFLRKTSLDELPQFWNVVCGQMSIVGPRPMMVDQQVLYPGDAYYRMRPGITGLWQISERNDAEFRERATFDAEYEAVMSPLVDFRILARTFGVVLRGTGY